MLTFDPPDLALRLLAALRKLHKHTREELEIDWAPFDVDTFDPAEYQDSVVTLDTTITLGLPRDDGREVPVRGILELAQDIDGAKLDASRQQLTSLTTFLYRVAPASEPADKYDYFTSTEDFGSHFVVESDHAGQHSRCSLRRGLTAFALEIVHLDDYDKHVPPIIGDLFVEVRGAGLTAQERMGVLWAYLFELGASTGIALRPASRPTLSETLGYDLDEQDGVVEHAKVARLRPLLSGPGLPAVLEAYARAIIVDEPDLRVLALVRALEWVSVTVVRSKGNEEVRKRLLSHEALAPNARFISDLFELLESHRAFRTDAAALQLTVETCCDGVALAHAAPAVATKLARITEASPAADKKEALAQLAKIFAATRNMIAHAKPNYRPTADECPVDQLPALAACLEMAVQQAIRWYSYSDATLRIL